MDRDVLNYWIPTVCTKCCGVQSKEVADIIEVLG
jgi:hypothetical protein